MLVRLQIPDHPVKQISIESPGNTQKVFRKYPRVFRSCSENIKEIFYKYSDSEI